MAGQTGLQSIMTHAPDIDSPWSGKYKIPWDEPEFSARMLTEHLSQSHDLASRRSSYIAKQADWIYEVICNNKPGKVLDLGCGPGFYLKNLAAKGFTGKGIDFSPASIEYAKKNTPETIELICEDIRHANFGEGYDLAMMIYGEFNVFSPEEISSILSRAYNSLNTGGVMLIESHTFEAVKRIGKAQDTWYKMSSGLFSAKSHLCLIDNHWNGELKVALQYFHIIDIESGEARHYRSTTKAWSDDDYRRLLEQAGYKDVIKDNEWESNTNDLFLLKAVK